MPMRLAIIVPRFNPCGYVRPHLNYDRFRESLRQQVDVKNVVFAYGDDNSFVWQKESLINIAIRTLPAEYDAVAWIDGDLLFSNPDWYADTCHALEQTPVVQMFETIIYLDPNDVPMQGGYGTAAAGDRLGFRAPGGAIACRRELLEHGIYDRHPLGGGDEIFMDACMGRASRWCYRLNEPFRDHVLEWALAFGQHTVGFIRGGVRHLWHGDRKGRQYTSRHQLLASHDFDPAVDVRVGDNGLLEWASDKPALHAAVKDYFTGRNEDG